MRTRRTRVAVLLTAAAIGATVAGPPPLRADDTVLAAQAESIITTVDIGGAGLAVPAGIARATLAGNDAQASANLVDYGLIATLIGVLLGEGTTFPAPVKATSDGPPSASRSTTLPAFGALSNLTFGPATAGTSIEEAHVGAGPSAGSRTDLGPMRIADVGTISGAASSTELSPERAIARATIAEVSLPGALVLRSVEWWAEARPDELPTAGFRIGALSIAGLPLPPGPGGFDLEALNQLLGPLGVHFDMPVVIIEGTRATVSPLVIRYGDSPLAAGTIGPLYTALSPALIELFNSIQAGSPEAGYLLYVTNIALASVAGLGVLTINLGGATASHERRAFDDAAAPTEPAVDSGAVVPSLPLTPAFPSALPPVAGPVVDNGPPLNPAFPAAPAATRRLDDRVSDGLVFALVGAGVLGLILLVVGRRRRDASAAGASA